jgi:hypothetical protein
VPAAEQPRLRRGGEQGGRQLQARQDTEQEQRHEWDVILPVQRLQRPKHRCLRLPGERDHEAGSVLNAADAPAGAENGVGGGGRRGHANAAASVVVGDVRRANGGARRGKRRGASRSDSRRRASRCAARAMQPRRWREGGRQQVRCVLAPRQRRERVFLVPHHHVPQVVIRQLRHRRGARCERPAVVIRISRAGTAGDCCCVSAAGTTRRSRAGKRCAGSHRCGSEEPR